MQNNFSKVMEHIFQWEGGYVDHPDDPGGATNMGITRTTLSNWRGRPVSKQEVRDLTKAEAEEIYEKSYWKNIRGDDMPNGLDLVMMDAGVNSGPSQSIKWLQRALLVEDDGILGPITMGAVRASQSLSGLINKTLDERLKSVRQFRNYNVFGRGWENRIRSTRRHALELLNG